jgi:hypothetical protein
VKASPLCSIRSASNSRRAVGLEIDSEVRPNAAGNAPLALFSLSTAVFGAGAVHEL